MNTPATKEPDFAKLYELVDRQLFRWNARSQVQQVSKNSIGLMARQAQSKIAELTKRVAALEAGSASASAVTEATNPGFQCKTVKIGEGCITSTMKAECIAEFSFSIKDHCSECEDVGADESCPICAGEIEYDREIIVPWGTCKEIYKGMLAAAPEIAPSAVGRQAMVPIDRLKQVRRDLDACQKVIWYAGGFDPAYCNDALERLKEIDGWLAAASQKPDAE